MPNIYDVTRNANGLLYNGGNDKDFLFKEDGQEVENSGNIDARSDQSYRSFRLEEKDLKAHKSVDFRPYTHQPKSCFTFKSRYKKNKNKIKRLDGNCIWIVVAIKAKNERLLDVFSDG